MTALVWFEHVQSRRSRQFWIFQPIIAMYIIYTMARTTSFVTILLIFKKNIQIVDSVISKSVPLTEQHKKQNLTSIFHFLSLCGYHSQEFNTLVELEEDDKVVSKSTELVVVLL